MTRTKHMASGNHKGRRRPHKEATPEAAGPSSGSPSRRGPRQAPPSVPGKPKRTHRCRPGTVALRQIRQLQKTGKLLIPAAPFIRTVREISSFLAPEITRWTAEALLALQEAAEDYMIQLFHDAMLCAIHAKRVTLSKRVNRAKGLGVGKAAWGKGATVVTTNIIGPSIHISFLSHSHVVWHVKK